MVNDKGVYVGVEEDDSDDESKSGDEDLGNIWNEMAMGIVCSKVYMSEDFVKMELKCQSFVFSDKWASYYLLLSYIFVKIEIHRKDLNTDKSTSMDSTYA